MTEAEWLRCNDAQQMLAFLGGKASDRKLRLAVAGWSYSRHATGSSPSMHSAILLAERFADGLATRAELRKAYYAGWGRFATEAVLRSGLAHARHSTTYIQNRDQHWPSFCALLRDIFGNPFRPVTADPAWLTSDAVALASGIYAERAFDRLPILADALQDAGCDNADVLGHCRSDGPHVRGCWVVDLLLGKA